MQFEQEAKGHGQVSWTTFNNNEPKPISISDHMVQLTDGTDEPKSQRLTSGFVEIHHRGRHLPVCVDGWTGENSAVVCRQLGYLQGELTQASIAPPTYKPNTIWMQNTNCTGSENRLDACAGYRWSRGGCGSTSVHVTCSWCIVHELSFLHRASNFIFPKWQIKTTY